MLEDSWGLRRHIQWEGQDAMNHSMSTHGLLLAIGKRKLYAFVNHVQWGVYVKMGCLSKSLEKLAPY